MDVLVELFANLYDAVLCVFFVSRFNKASFKGKRRLIPIISVLIILAYSVLSDKFFSSFSILSTSLYLALYIIYGLIVCQGRYVYGVLSGIFFEIIIVLVSSATFTILSNSINDFEIALQTGTSVRYIFIAICKIGLFGTSMLVLRLFNSRKTLNILSGALSFVLTLITIIGMGMTLNIATQTGGNMDSTPIVLIAVSFIAVNIIFYILVAQIQKLLENKFQLKLLEDKIEFERKRLADSEEAYQTTKKLQHDMKNHLTVIAARLDDNDIEGCREYLRELVPAVERMGRIIRTDNQTLDYIINSKLGRLSDTKVIVSGSAGDLSDISDLDLACLFGNLLDNAVEAQVNVPSREKHIELLFARQKSNRIIVCKNTIASSVLENNKSLKTTKKDKGSHGYGTKIIEKIVSDYGGMIDYYEEFGMFCVQIVLPTKVN